MAKIKKNKKDHITALVELPNVVISFKLAENTFIRASITPDGELYLNASWGTLLIKPDSANTCFVSILSSGERLESPPIPEGEDEHYESRS